MSEITDEERARFLKSVVEINVYKSFGHSENYKLIGVRREGKKLMATYELSNEGDYY